MKADGPRRRPHGRMDSLYAATVIVIAACFLTAIYPVSRPHPFSDDWTFANIVGAGWRDFIEWIFIQHVDHRIPLVKAVQYLVLRITRFDFRALVLLNFAVAVSGVLAYAQFARRYRGHLALGDLIVPLILLNFSFGLFGWAFSAQFSFSVSLALVFLFVFVAAQQQASRPMLTIALATLLACGMCGMNGLVLAFVSAGTLLLAFLRAPHLPMRRENIGGLLLVLAILLLVVFNWKPSGASSSLASLDLKRLCRWLLHLAKSSFTIDAVKYKDWLAISCALFILAGAVKGLASAASLARGRLPVGDAALLAVFAGFLAVGLVVAIGRSGTSEWSPGLEMHYGYLVAPLVPLSWLMISTRISGRLSMALGAVLVVLYAHAYHAGTKWRFEYLSANQRSFTRATEAVTSDADAAAVAREYIKDYYYIDTPDTLAQVAHGISKLRDVGGPLYTARTVTGQ